jgi:xanthine dehydrogenase accessory factor
VRAQALEVLATATPRLVRITPSPEDVGVVDDDGVVTVHNPCLSGGTLEIFLEPSVPLPVVAVFGHAPIATALLRAHRVFGQQVLPLEKPDDPLPPGTRAVVVASHGNDEEPVLEAALRAEVPYIALVASRRRGPAVLASLEVNEQLRSRVHTPAGLDIGARTAPEVALSILAEIVAVVHELPFHRDDTLGPASDLTETVRDPVCGMMVAPVDASHHVETPTGVVYFCGSGCRNAYLDNPLAYAQ